MGGVIARSAAVYSGPLTYAANGCEPADEFTSVSFWGQVDLLGADVYTPLTDKTNPTAGRARGGLASNR